MHGAGLANGSLFERAVAIRDAAWGRTATYSRKVFIPLTNLCRDECGYCVFARPPEEDGAGYLTPDEVLAIARRGEAAGCKEALFSLGERPEKRFPQARKALRRLGYETTIEYLVDMCRLVRDETGLLPHANPGRMTREELTMLRPVTASMGMMLESVSDRLHARGGAHFRCPDKVPAVRLETLRAAGRLNIPFTTGILIGIGETREERVASLEAIVEIQNEYGHIQEVIIQNFLPKPGTPMAHGRAPSLADMLETIALARVILPEDVGLQAPPNLTPGRYGRFLDAGINDWGGVSPITRDHINPEAAWPKIEELAEETRRHGMELKERLTLYPKFTAEPERWLAPEIREKCLSLAYEMPGYGLGSESGMRHGEKRSGRC
ncbi:MAG: 7,8-didemethyl-8-hydroxy-5-deazariboflavin synthase subunit CofG [Candidatus Hydrogenedentota bacterium]|nr:MAG: 7,8-didemethyl-8-hydroxy-5-deazariboflavin synthase subunit CofG [Candidatus Hydrogenedentota bacterium]